MPGRAPVAVERLRCRGSRLSRRKRYRHSTRTCSSGCSRQPGSRFRIGCFRSAYQHRLGSACRRNEQPVAFSQLDVALPFAGRRRRTPVYGSQGFVGFLLCASNQRADRKRLAVNDPEISGRRKDHQPGNCYRISWRRGFRHQESRFSGNGKQSENYILSYRLQFRPAAPGRLGLCAIPQ